MTDTTERQDDDGATLAEIGRQDALRSRLRRRPSLTTVVFLVLGAVFGAVGTLTWQVTPTARSVSGVLGAIDDSGSAVLLAEPADLADIGFGLVGVLWRETGREGTAPGEWQRAVSDAGFPTCLSPGDEGRTLRLGLVTDPGGSDRPVSQVVAWLECGPPVEGS